VVGSLSGGKLGLGKGQRRGFQLKFRPIPSKDLPEIDFIACGMSHMLAISRCSDDPALPQGKGQAGTTYAWGKNLRGQLGIGSKENQFSPMPIQNTKERFRKVACGYNFSLGLSPSNRVYFWGNFKYSSDISAKKDIEEPTLISALESNEVHDIACEAKHCLALIDDGKLKKWGKFLLEKDITEKKAAKVVEKGAKKDEQKKETRVEMAEPFPQSLQKSSNKTKFCTISTGPNHAVALSASDHKAYVWGYNNLQNRLGLASKADDEKAKAAPQVLSAMEHVLQEQRESRSRGGFKQQEGAMEADEEIDEEEEDDEGLSQLEEEEGAGGAEEDDGGDGKAEHDGAT